jgi:hypothetical protein
MLTIEAMSSTILVGNTPCPRRRLPLVDSPYMIFGRTFETELKKYDRTIE